MVEWSKAGALKAPEPKGSAGSNPALAAISLANPTKTHPDGGMRRLDSLMPPIRFWDDCNFLATSTQQQSGKCSQGQRILMVILARKPLSNQSHTEHTL